MPIAGVAKLGRLVVERQHLELLGLLPPHLDQLTQLVRILGRHVGRLRHVVGNVVQLPVIKIERRMRVETIAVVHREQRVERNGFPPVVIQRA